MRLKVILPILLLAALFAASFFYPRVTQIRVVGNLHLSALEVERLAGVRPNMAWLWYGVTSGASAAKRDPWIKALKVVRIFPSSIELSVTERVPVARVVQGGQILALAADGTVLPGGALVGPLISGWGPDRRLEALEAIAALKGYGVRNVSYASSGLRISSTKGSLWVESLDSLYRYASLLGASESGIGKSKMTYIYPWGVSVQQ